MSNGLDMMKAAREKRRPQVGNEMPQPLHRARTTPVTLPAPAPDDDRASDSRPAEEAATSPNAANVAETSTSGPLRSARATDRTEAPANRPRPSRSDSTVASAADELHAVTAYLEMTEDQFIREIIAAGRYGKPKVTSASAVIRYAVQHLAAQKTPAQVVAEIRAAAPKTSNQGRVRL